jgi:electron transport complex protein RnfD
MAAHVPPGSALDRSVGTAVDRLLGPAGAVPEGMIDLLMGNRAGAIGELSALLLLAGAAYLIGKRVVAWQIPASLLGTVALLAWVVGSSGSGPGRVAAELLGGGLILAAFFMATDPVTSPLTPGGKVFFGIGCGALTYLVRRLGVYPEGTAFAIVLMNALVPAINRITRRRGGVKEVRP